MNIKPISSPVRTTKEYHTGEKDIKTPDYFCKSCEKREQRRCTFFKRPIVQDYNKCFNHSNYHPVATQYQSPCNIAEIAEENTLCA